MKIILGYAAYGFLVWLVPFVIGMLLFSLVSVESALFDTVMAITLTASTAVFSFLNFKNRASNKQSLSQLVAIGLSYTVIPIIFVAIGLAFNQSGNSLD